MSPYFRGVSGRAVLTLAMVSVGAGVLLRVAGVISPATAPEPTTVARVAPVVQVVAEVGPACAELARLERHHVTSGPSYTRAARACRREASDGP